MTTLHNHTRYMDGCVFNDDELMRVADDVVAKQTELVALRAENEKLREAARAYVQAVDLLANCRAENERLRATRDSLAANNVALVRQLHAAEGRAKTSQLDQR